jgi:asparagine synthase (glutamine-hydrolysing)
MAETASNIGPEFRICLETDLGWRRFDETGITIWFKGHVAGDALEQLSQRLGARGVLEPEAAVQILSSLDGHWALAATGPTWTLAAVDRVRSIPLIWAADRTSVAITQTAGAMAQRFALTPAGVDRDAAVSIALAGYTIGNDTLYQGVGQLGPGQYLLLDRSGAQTVGRYHQWTPWRPEDAGADDLVTPLAELHERLIEKLIAGAEGRPILVPLSAGLDSRFIAAGLREAGYADVVCFAYGIPGNREAEVSRRVADRLGYPWHFVPYSNHAMRAALASDDHARLRAGADNLTGVHFPQDYLALMHLLDGGVASRDMIVVNGQSGDFITGNHIPLELHEPGAESSTAARADRVITAVLAKHFKQWDSLRSRENMMRLATRIGQEIDAVGGLPRDASGDHGLYEYCEFQDRQAKYVIAGQRVYEHFGLDWRLPLWDQDALDFWGRAPFAAKVGQSLYRRVLARQNWAGAWGADLPVNPTLLRPSWLVPIRFALKALHTPLGRARWHDFERRYLNYFMSPLCTYAGQTWRQVAGDRRGHASGIAWHIEAYLNQKGVTLDDLAG